MEKEVFLTKEGYDKLKREYDELSSTGRKEMAEKIKIAREFGDLSENAEYDAAKEEQGFLEKRIREINENAQQLHDYRRKHDRYQNRQRRLHRKTSGSGIRGQARI